MLKLHAVPEPVAALLGQLASHDALKPFALGGGTSLALRFGHRLSVDLDYFTTGEFDPGLLSEKLGFFSTIYPATDPFTVIRSLVWFEDAEQEPDPIPLAGQEWRDIKGRIIHAVRDCEGFANGAKSLRQ